MTYGSDCQSQCETGSACHAGRWPLTAICIGRRISNDIRTRVNYC